ncbi:hypothetical protein QQP08_011742, partial [Theobroma cacao]
EIQRERVKRRCCDNDPTLIFIKHSASATTCSIYDRSHMNKVNKLVTCDHDPNIIPITANLTAFTADIKTRYTTPELQYLINFSLSSSLKTLLFRNLAPWEGSTTSTSNLPGIGGVNESLEVGIPKVLAKARLLFLDLAAAQFRWWR